MSSNVVPVEVNEMSQKRQCDSDYKYIAKTQLEPLQTYSEYLTMLQLQLSTAATGIITASNQLPFDSAANTTYYLSQAKYNLQAVDTGSFDYTSFGAILDCDTNVFCKCLVTGIYTINTDSQNPSRLDISDAAANQEPDTFHLLCILNYYSASVMHHLGSMRSTPTPRILPVSTSQTWLQNQEPDTYCHSLNHYDASVMHHSVTHTVCNLCNTNQISILVVLLDTATNITTSMLTPRSSGLIQKLQYKVSVSPLPGYLLMHDPLTLFGSVLLRRPTWLNQRSLLFVHEGTIEFEEATNAMADDMISGPLFIVLFGAVTSECFHHVSGMPVKTELQALGNCVAIYFTVQSLVVGEQKVHCAIRRTLAASR
ncbi:hypothetical protein F4604DRAFT_1682501 [Suillus subluteus]|nr:hypothetical protein F4604DRAFT_1682501 [Suillus subluteus]